MLISYVCIYNRTVVTVSWTEESPNFRTCIYSVGVLIPGQEPPRITFMLNGFSSELRASMCSASRRLFECLKLESLCEGFFQSSRVSQLNHLLYRLTNLTSTSSCCRFLYRMPHGDSYKNGSWYQRYLFLHLHCND